MADDDKEKETHTDPPTPPTTEPPTPPSPAPTPPPTPPTADADKDDLREVVKGLSDVVTGLVTSVTALVENGQQLANDKVPVKVPWTHKGGGRYGELDFALLIDMNYFVPVVLC